MGVNKKDIKEYKKIQLKFDSEELSQLITESGVTYAKISSELGVFPQNVYQWVTFKRPIPEKYHMPLSNYLL